MDLQLGLLVLDFVDLLQDALMCQLNHLFEDLFKDLQMLLRFGFESAKKQAHLQS